MFMKKYWKQITSGLLAIIAILLIILVINFKNSAAYARFELAVAAQNKDSSICDKYYDYDKIVDSYIMDYYKQIEDNPFAGWGYSMMENMRPAMVKRFKAEITASFEEGVPKKVNVVNLLYRNIFNEPNTGLVKVEKFGNKKEKFYKCIENKNYCSIYVWEKIDKIWKVTGISLINPEEISNDKK